MSIPLFDVIDSVRGRAPHPSWVTTVQRRVAEERARVMSHLQEVDRSSVYGFDTMLGPLDNSPVVTQQELLDAHLAGRQCSKSDAELRMMTAVKVQQISNGGSGIHPITYAGLVESLWQDNGNAQGAWNDSYSSGDVVPASWWAKHLQEAGAITTLEAGDTIALINGHFVSTAAGVTAFEALLDYFAVFLAAAGQFTSPNAMRFRPDTHADLAALIWGPSWDEPVHLSGIQLPVSTRDGGFYLTEIVNILTHLAGALNDRLKAKSSNPQFHFGDDGEVTSLSQSSFLGFGLTTASTAAVQRVALLMGAVQRFTSIRSDELQSAAQVPTMRFVQPPKLSSAVLAEARLRHGAIPLVFTGSESGGVEDLWDLSLQAAAGVSDIVELAQAQLDLLGQMDPLAVGGPLARRAIRHELTKVLRRQLGDPAGMDVDEMSEVAA